MRNLTFEINRQECAGDSVGKHNYNTLALDTAICNLSSQIFNISNNILSVFNDISSNSGTYSQIAQQFSDAAAFKFKINNTTIKNLSSYWQLVEFNPQFQFDLYTLDSFNNTSTNLILGSPNIYTPSSPLSAIITNATSYLSYNFPVSNYNIGSKANVLVLLHNTANTAIIDKKYTIVLNGVQTEVSTPEIGFQLLDDYNPNNTSWTWNGVNFGQIVSPVKSVKVDYFKTNVVIKNSVIVKFKKINNSFWTFTGILST